MFMRIITNKNLSYPPENTRIWRYMDLSKFLDLIVGKRLYFTNLARLSDQYEGAIPQAILHQKRSELEESGLIEEDINFELAVFQHYQSAMPELTLVNCWSMGEEQSYALWKIYLGGQKYGVAIQSRVNKLLKAIENGEDPYPEDLFVGTVNYQTDSSKEALHRLRLITHKMPFYSYENELRLIILNYPLSEGGTEPSYSLSHGRHVQIDLDQMVEKIYISPFAEPWFHETLEAILKFLNPLMVTRLHISPIRDR